MTIKDPFYQREKDKYDNPIPSREYILNHLTEQGIPLSFDELTKALKLTDEDMIIGLKRRLRAMEREGQIIFTRAKRYALPGRMELVKGKVIGHRDGYGFLQLDEGGDDWFIPSFEMKKLIHGDRILAKSHKVGFKNKQEASLVRVLESRPEPILGRYYLEAGMGLVVPEDARICQDILIQPGEENGARVNQVVCVEMTQRPSHRMNAMGRITEVMGEHMDPGMEIEIAVRNYDIPFIWPEAVEKQVAKLTPEVPEKAKAGRVDLRMLPLVTIDGEDARDFDDAVYCEVKRGGGWRLWVAIADVSSYVKLGTALDKEAENRGTSVYFPENVIPMLPEALSNGLCSLNPKVDRLCMVCEMTISAKGKLSGYKFYEAVMNSACRFTYTDVAAILDGDKKLRDKHAELVPALENLHDLYKCLQPVRKARGAIEFETIETRFVFNERRKIDKIVPVVRNDAHKLIEECMILANIAAAKLIEKHEAHALFRVHDEPDMDKLANFRSFLGELGIVSKLPFKPDPVAITEELARLSDRDDIELIQIMLLRSMKQAVYQEENYGHFGLALKEYAHFTSPIRRYPDLVVHRTIKGILKAEGQKTTGAHLYKQEEAEALGVNCSMTERRADEATREVSDWLKCEYMQDHLGEVFDGIIASVTNFGFFVRINDLYVDGLVHVTSLRNDYYHFDATRHLLIGESSRKTYRMGDAVVVKVAQVNLDQRKIDFVLVENGGRNRRSSRKPKANHQASEGKGMSVREQLAKGMVGSDEKKPRRGKAGAKLGTKPGGKSGSRFGDANSSSGKAADSAKKTGKKPGKKTKASKNKKVVKKKSRPGKNARNKAKQGR